MTEGDNTRRRLPGQDGWWHPALAVLVGALTLMPPVTAGAQTAPGSRHMLRLDQVSGALLAAMLPLEGAEVRLLAQTSASTPEPKLEVKALEPWGERSARVRMGCEAHEQCIPFYVAVEWADAPAAQAALHAAGSRGSSAPVPHAALPVHPGAPPASVHPDLPATTMHAGSHATLLLDGERLHIKVPVICLGSGNPGSTIRVTAVDHKRTYLAEIVDTTLLKGTL